MIPGVRAQDRDPCAVRAAWESKGDRVHYSIPYPTTGRSRIRDYLT